MPMVGATPKGYRTGNFLQMILSAVGLLMLLLSPTCTAAEWSTVYAIPFITSNITKFGPGIEGVAVDYDGTAYAVAYAGESTNGMGSIASPEGEVKQVLFSLDKTGSISYNGLRFLPLSKELSKNFLSRSVGTDVRGHQVIHLLGGTIDGRVRTYEFCGNGTMAQPNDIAVAAKSGKIYLSGGKYGLVTTTVGDGDLWMCGTVSSFYCSKIDELGTVPATLLGLFGLTNGIEISPDESTLYLTEAFHRDGLVISNKIWKFAIDPTTGGVSNQTLFVDFAVLDGSEGVDLDGIRADMEGNLYVAKNGMVGEVVKLSPDGKLLMKIYAPGLKEVTNMDLAGTDGTTLYIAGKCIDQAEFGCVDVLYGNSSPGRAWQQLRIQPDDCPE